MKYKIQGKRESTQFKYSLMSYQLQRDAGRREGEWEGEWVVGTKLSYGDAQVCK
jgi:hypothetical protein